jgi:hypothetical protein
MRDNHAINDIIEIFVLRQITEVRKPSIIMKIINSIYMYYRRALN